MRFHLSLPRLATSLAAALAAAVALGGCGGTVDFVLEKDLDVNSAVNAGVTTATFDLAAEAGSAWKHRDKISSVSVNQAEAKVTEKFAPNTATTVSGEVWLLPEGATAPGAGAVKVGSYSGAPVAVGTIIPLELTPGLNAFVEQAFNGSGRFGVYAVGAGASGEVVACRLHVTVDVAVKWKAF
jgi:hypothetical protein